MAPHTILPPVNSAHRIQLEPIATPSRLLLGPGPSNAHPTVLAALARTPIGHLDPLYIQLMSEVQELLRYAWQTDNRLTLPMSGTGSAAMEATIANVVEPGDKVVVAVMGYFGLRQVDMASRYGAEVITIERPWGEAFSLEELDAALTTHKPAVLAMVHAETSTGVCQPMEGIGALCRRHDCLLLLDTVTSLGGVPLFLDEWQVDLAYSCSQKGLSCPPGLGPFTMGPRAEAKLNRRKGKVPNWYLDVSLLNKYWGSDRVYHHTAPVNMNFGMREALRLLSEEGLEQAWAAPLAGPGEAGPAAPRSGAPPPGHPHHRLHPRWRGWQGLLPPSSRRPWHRGGWRPGRPGRQGVAHRPDGLQQHP